MKTADLLELVSQAVREINPGLFPYAAPAPVAPPSTAKGAKIAEKDLQRAVENWLHERGYFLLCPPAIGAARTGLTNPRGFFGHWFESQRNAFMPDLCVIPWPNTRPVLLLELKVRNVYQSGQKDAITLGLWRVAFDLAEAQDIIDEWEKTQ